MSVPPGIIIDACNPRSAYERACKVFEYLVTMPGSVVDDTTEELDPGHTWQKVFGTLEVGDSEAESDSLWAALEDQIIDEINTRLPDDSVCTVGEFQPGDVIVRAVGDPDEEIDLMEGRN